MNQLPALLVREFQEYRNMVLYVPLAVTAIVVLLQLLALSAVGIGEEGWLSMTVQLDNGETRTLVLGVWYEQMIENLSRMSAFEQAEMIDIAYFGVSWPLFGILWFFVLFYLLGSLYEDRRDRSILFWKSMPVSDAVTVASKLVMGLLVIPAIYLGFVFVSQLVFLITSTLSLDSNTPENVVDLIVDPVGMFERWLQFVGFHLVTIVWCAPFYTWTLLVSSAARSIPFIWFVGVPLALIVVDSMMITGELRGFIGRHTLPVGLDDEHVWSLSETVVLYATDWELLAAIVIAAVFVYLTVRMRGRADEI